MKLQYTDISAPVHSHGQNWLLEFKRYQRQQNVAKCVVIVPTSVVVQPLQQKIVDFINARECRSDSVRKCSGVGGGGHRINIDQTGPPLPCDIQARRRARGGRGGMCHLLEKRRMTNTPGSCLASSSPAKTMPFCIKPSCSSLASLSASLVSAAASRKPAIRSLTQSITLRTDKSARFTFPLE